VIEDVLKVGAVVQEVIFQYREIVVAGNFHPVLFVGLRQLWVNSSLAFDLALVYQCDKWWKDRQEATRREKGDREDFQSADLH
jgi:hypothetical protein